MNYNPFWWIYDYFFINHTIEEQMDMLSLDLALLAYYKEKFANKNIQK